MDLEHKWTAIRENCDTVEAYDRSQATANSFLLVFNDRAGDGPSAIDVTAVGAFEDAADCLAYLRYYELPEMLDWRATFEQTSGRDRGEPEESEKEPAGDITALAAELERLLEGETGAEELEALRSRWNEAFALSNPGSTIEAWGDVAGVLVSAYVAAVLEDEDEDGAFEALLASARFGELDVGDPARFAEVMDALASVERS